MNKVVGIQVIGKDKSIRHTIELTVEFAEPCTQWEANEIILESFGDLLFKRGCEVKKNV